MERNGNGDSLYSASYGIGTFVHKSQAALHDVLILESLEDILKRTDAMYHPERS